MLIRLGLGAGALGLLGYGVYLLGAALHWLADVEQDSSAETFMMGLALIGVCGIFGFTCWALGDLILGAWK